MIVLQLLDELKLLIFIRRSIFYVFPDGEAVFLPRECWRLIGESFVMHCG
jgi:hypothetical protein